MPDYFLNMLNKLYRKDIFTIDLFKTISKMYEALFEKLNETRAQFFFDTMTIVLPRYEKWLGLIPIKEQTIEERRSNVEARWKSKGHNSIELIQNVASSWKNGEVKIDFIDGKLKINFLKTYGKPNDLEALKIAVDIVKPAHIGYELNFKYLRKKEIHRILTKSQMQKYKKNQYYKGGTDA